MGKWATSSDLTPNDNDKQTFQFHEMELLVLLHEKDMQIWRFRLPSLLKKGKQKSQLNSNSWGADKRRNKMVTRRRTVLTGWTRITSKYLSRLPLRRRLANFCESLCKANEVFRGVWDSDPGCPNKPEDLCYMDDFFLWTVSRWKYILLNCRWNFNFEKGKKEKNVFSFAGIEFNITTSNAELLLLLFFCFGRGWIS